MSAQPKAQPPVASPPSSRRRYVAALLALLLLGLGLTLWLTRPGQAPVIALDGAGETPGANPQSSDLYAAPKLPTTVTQSGTTPAPVAPLTPTGNVSPATPTTASLPSNAAALQGASQVARAFAQSVGRSSAAESPTQPTRPGDGASQPAPAVGPGSLATTWAGTTPVGGTNTALVPLDGLTETTPIGLTSPIGGQSSGSTTTAVNVPVAAAIDVPDRTGLTTLLALVGALLLAARCRLGRA